MVVSVASSLADSERFDGVITGVRDPRRLKGVVDAGLDGHLGDPDLDAVVATLRLACAAPIVVVTYAAEVGVGAACTSVPDALSFCAEVVDTGRPMTITNAATHPVYSQNPMVRSGTIGSYAGVPLVDNGIVLGSVAIFDRHPRVFSADDLEILGHQGKLAGSVLALRRSARMDALTGLPNRALYSDHLAGALARLERGDGFICVMYLDIDDFKIINDTLGHGGDDNILIELGRRLTRVLRPTDTVARFGGDEFVILCQDLDSVGDAEQLAARVVAATTEPWDAQGWFMPVHLSIGFTVTDSATTEPTALLDDADTAMYLAKKTPGSTSVLAPSRQTEPRSPLRFTQ
jgi:diguanylate cyclase (GGDEF)-like protein